MDKKIRVNVGGEIRIYAESDITVIPALRLKGEEIKKVFVEVTYAGKTFRGTVTPDEARKLLPGTSSKNRKARIKKDEEDCPIVELDKPKMRRTS